MHPGNPAPRRQATPLSSLTLLASLSLLSLFPSAAAAGKGDDIPLPPDPELVHEVVAGGVGWSQIHVWAAGVDDAKKSLEEPVADLLMVTPEGIDALPIDQVFKDELYEDFGLGGGIDVVDFGAGQSPLEAATADKGSSCPQQAPSGSGGQFIIIDRRFLAHHRPESLTLPAEYQALADAEAAKAIEVPMDCNGWDNESKSATWNVSHTGVAYSFPLGGSFTGNFAVNFPFQTAGNANIQYRVKRFLCAPYKFQLRNYHATGTLQSAGDAQLEVAASVAYNWTKDWPIADPRIARIMFTIGFIPIRLDFHLPVSVGLALGAEVSGTLSQSFDYGVGGSFDYTCTTESCCGSNNIQEHFDTDGDINSSLQARINAEANAKVQVRAEVWSSSLFNAQAGVKGFVQGTVFGYQGNTCGDGDGDGQNENVQGLIAEAKAGVDLIFSVGGSLAPDISGSYPGPRWDLGWWDLLDGNSTILSPMVSGPATAAAGSNVEYRVKMRPCYPYSSPVAIAVGPGSWNGVMTIAEPRGGNPATNSTAVSRSFPNAGQQNLSFTAVSDAAGRDLNTTTARTLQVTPPAAISPWSGSWFNPARPGNGLDLYRNAAGHYVVMYYTYVGSQPVWYLSNNGSLVANTFSGSLTRYTWNFATGTRNPGQVVGGFDLQFTSSNAATFNWTINGVSGSEPYQHLHGGGGRTGMYGGTNGVGMMIDESNGVASVSVAYYNASGSPTWATGTGEATLPTQVQLIRYTSTGLCPGCGGTPSTTGTSVGSVTIEAAPSGPALIVDVDLPSFNDHNVVFNVLAN